MGDLQGGASMDQSVPSMGQENHSGGQMVQSGIGMNQNMMSGLGQSGVSSGTGTMIPIPGMPQQAQSGMQSLGVNKSTAANMPLSQQTSSTLQPSQSKYVKMWEGSLYGERQRQRIFITKLEGYRSSSASEMLAANWPLTMQIGCLISQNHMHNKQYVGKADFLVFGAMNQHGFLEQLQGKKLCAVIQLPSQTLLLAVSYKACHLIGMLFPAERTWLCSSLQYPASSNSNNSYSRCDHSCNIYSFRSYSSSSSSNFSSGVHSQQSLPQLQEQQLSQLQQQQQLPELQLWRF